MGDELELPIDVQFGAPFFVPSHATKFLVAAGVAVGATGVALLSGAYALSELRKIKAEEVSALLSGGEM